MIEWATEIKVRAERKAGELIEQAKARGELTAHGGDRKSQSRSHSTNLNDVGVSADQSSRWQSLAGMSDEHFETAVATAKDSAGQVTTAFMLREAEREAGGESLLWLPVGEPKKARRRGRAETMRA